MSMENNAKLVVLHETITTAIKNGNLSDKMDLIKLQAAELGLSDTDLKKLINNGQNNADKQRKIKSIAMKHKALLSAASIGVVLFEWILGFIISTMSFGTVLLILLVNIISVIFVIIIASIVINRKLK